MKNSIRTVIIGSPSAGTAAIFSILDILSSVGRDWEMLHGAPPSEPNKFQPLLCTMTGAPYLDINGRKVTPDAALDAGKLPDLIIVPDIHIDFGGPLPDDLIALSKWIGDAHAKGVMTTSVCSGTMLLATGGVLDGREATTHWGVADLLATQFPKITVRRERILCPTGEGHNVVTAGGSSSWVDLVLYLIARLVDADTARRIAKVWLLNTHNDGQLNYASLAAGRQYEDKIIADAQAWLSQHYMKTFPVSGLVERSGMSARGFLRRFRRATGHSPAEYVQTLRVEEAKQMLETTNLAIDEIAGEVGYTEPSSFRSAFRKNVGMSASVYRRKWQPF
ncbi:helix-turn-helix domain-containing protein [Thalassospira sp.]|uniref:GlxA family transcriptional regulator n=1 Tax=Thalassospira sp. TaxID=1912094 RepID=UPI0032EC7DCA